MWHCPVGVSFKVNDKAWFLMHGREWWKTLHYKRWFGFGSRWCLT